jgi:hypothetical protein
MTGRNQKQILLLLLHPFSENISKAATFNALLAKQIVSLVPSRHCNEDQNRSQLHSSKNSLHKRGECFSQNHIISRPNFQMRAATPTKIKLLSFFLMPVNNFFKHMCH